MTLAQALEALVAECPWKLPAETHRSGAQRHVHLGHLPVSCHSASFVLALPDGGWRRSDAQVVYEGTLAREMKP